MGKPAESSDVGRGDATFGNEAGDEMCRRDIEGRFGGGLPSEGCACVSVTVVLQMPGLFEISQ